MICTPPRSKLISVNSLFCAGMWAAFGLFTLCLTTGCVPTKPAYLHDSGDLSYYLDQATQVEYPDVEMPSLDEVTQAYPPMTVVDPDFEHYEDITLEDAVSYALQNAKVLRGFGTPSLLGTRVSPGLDNLSNGPAAAGTIYNVAVRESEPGVITTPGAISNPATISTNTALDVNQGVESALAEFDAYFTSGISWTKTDEPRNTVPTSPLSPLVFVQDQVQWQSEVGKKSANGTQIFFRNVNTYTENNNPLAATGGLQVLDSWYRASFEAEVRQPLLRGRGAFINRMPIVISRIGTDQELANLEAQLQNFVTNVEIRYWDLYCAYRNLDSAKKGRDAALETWRIVKDNFDEGADVNIQQVAQASEQYHFFDAQVIDAYNALLNAEGSLRFLLGWSSTDGRVLRPSDEPILAPVEFAWCESLCEALTYRPELRQERWEIKKRELALAYSKNGLLPELNATVLYRWLGLGNKYSTSGNSQPFPDTDSAALNELYNGDYQELQFGIDYRAPIGFRRELANVRNAQLKLAREIARLEDMELDVTKELTEAFRALAANQMIMQASFNRWKDTTIEQKHFKELEDAGIETLDISLDSQRRQAQAEIAFYTALCEYNKIIALIHRRKGTILSYCGVCFSEGPWPGKAYLDAEEHARRRGASRQINYGWTRPQIISRGEDWPSADNTGSSLSLYPQPAYNPSAPVEVIDEGIIESEIYSGPYYEDEVPLQDAIQQAEPTPAVQQPMSRVYRDAQIQQTSHTAEVKIVSAEEARAIAERSRPVEPAAVLKTVSQPKQPARDLTARPTRRLQATPQNSVPIQKTESGSKKRPTNKVANPVRKSHLNWEKLGFDRPEAPKSDVIVKIKTE